MRVTFTETAADELAEIPDYIALQNPSAAKGVALEVDPLIERLRTFPLSAQQTDRPECPQGRPRALPVPHLLYGGGDEIVVRNIRHGARRYP